MANAHNRSKCIKLDQVSLSGKLMDTMATPASEETTTTRAQTQVLSTFASTFDRLAAETWSLATRASNWWPNWGDSHRSRRSSSLEAAKLGCCCRRRRRRRRRHDDGCWFGDDHHGFLRAQSKCMQLAHPFEPILAPIRSYSILFDRMVPLLLNSSSVRPSAGGPFIATSQHKSRANLVIYDNNCNS